jgi:FkbM family methyltransferase
MKRKIFQPFWKYLFHLGKMGMNYWPESSVLGSGEIFAMKYANKKLTAAQQKIIFDVGANIGQFAMVAEKLFDNPKKIFCFEPSKATFELLNREITKDFFSKNFQTVNLGLSNSVRSDILFSPGIGASIASLHNIPDQIRSNQKEFSETVQLTTIDEFCNQNAIEKIDYLKLDIEGHEYFALKGASECLKNRKIHFIQFEFGQGSMAARVFFRDIFELLAANYSIYRIAKDGLVLLNKYSTDLEIFDAANYLAELI